MIITNLRYALVGYFITSYLTWAHGIIVKYKHRCIINNAYPISITNYIHTVHHPKTTMYLLKLALCANDVLAIQEANTRPVIKEFCISKWFNAAAGAD